MSTNLFELLARIEELEEIIDKKIEEGGENHGNWLCWNNKIYTG